MRVRKKYEFNLEDFHFFLHHTKRTSEFLRVFKECFQRNGFPGDVVDNSWNFLDVGCGSGELTVPLLNLILEITKHKNTAKEIHSFSAYLLDPCAKAINRIKKANEILKEALIKIDYLNFKFEDFITQWPPDAPPLKFDFILCSHVFYYFRDWDKIIGKILKFLNNNGMLCIVLKSKESGLFKLRKEIYSAIGYDDPITLEFSEDIAELLKKKGIAYNHIPVVYPVTISKEEFSKKGEQIDLSAFVKILRFIYHFPLSLAMKKADIKEILNNFMNGNSNLTRLSTMLRDDFIWISK